MTRRVMFCRRLVIGMRSAGSVGCPAADRFGAGAGEGALGAVGELDGDDVLGDVDGDDGACVAATESQFLAGDHNDPGCLTPGAGW